MNSLAAWAPAVITVLSAIFVAGRVSGRIKDQETTLVRHEAQIGIHAIAIAKLEAWREGYNAGSNRVKTHETARS